MTTSTSRRARLAAAGVLTMAVLAACGDDDSGSSATTAAPATSAAPAPTTAAAAAATSTSMGDMMMVEVNAIDYAFEDLPASVPAGTMLNLTNTSTEEVHELVAFRLADDETRPIDELVMLPEAELGALLAGEPATVIVAPPGEGGFPAVGDGTLAEPGRYAIMCFIPIGADPAEYIAAAQASTGAPPEVAGGPPHFTAGMFAELTVE